MHFPAQAKKKRMGWILFVFWGAVCATLMVGNVHRNTISCDLLLLPSAL